MLLPPPPLSRIVITLNDYKLLNINNYAEKKALLNNHTLIILSELYYIKGNKSTPYRNTQIFKYIS